MWTLLAEGDLGFPPGLNTAAMPWWVTAVFMAIVLAFNAYVVLQVRKTDLRKINTDIDLKLEAAREQAKKDEENSALAQWKAIARNEIKLRGEAEERHRKQQLESEESHNKKMADLVGATRAEVHELRNEMGARITRADSEIADLRKKEWKCQRRMARWEGIAKANGWNMPEEDESENWGDESGEIDLPPNRG